MSWLAKYFRTGVKNIAINGVLLPNEPTLNVIGATGADNPSSQRTDVTIQTQSFVLKTVNGAGSINMAADQLVFVDASSGTCTVNAPAVAAGAQWGITDIEPTSFNVSHGASVPNAGSNIEDPNNPGKYNSNPILMLQPSQQAVWIGDPTGTYWKLI